MATVASVYEIARFIRKPEEIIEDFFSTTESKTQIQRPRLTAKIVWARKGKIK